MGTGRQEAEETSPLTGSARVLAVLRHLAEHPDGSRLADVSAALGAPKSSAHRALGSLVQAGFARQDADGLYHLGFDLMRLVFGYHEARAPSLIVGPLLRRLADETGETTHYGVLVDGNIVYQAKVSPSRPTFQMSSVIGGSNPAYRTGLGKALLMHELTDRNDVDRYVADHGPLEARTPHTLRTPEALHDALREGRRNGYMLDLQENDLGIVCIALPLFLDSPSRPTGAISISAVVGRTTPDDLVGWLPRIREIVAEELGDAVLPTPEPSTGE
ncbi:IclR family transcriptional regulator [Kribbella sp. NPDC048915]|uniref:IclR family transcriptional regulator n=1 Tax=Kribbella sp. NPDC048915 TaxID=3155148 RepID=UPI0033DC142E